MPTEHADATSGTATLVEIPRFYIVAECGNCDEEMFYGPCATLLEHRGLPVVAYDIASQTTFSCDHCGADNYTGDVDMYCEGGAEQDDEDEDDDFDEPERSQGGDTP